MSPDDIKAEVASEAKKRIDDHVANDTTRYKLLVWVIIIFGIVLACQSIAVFHNINEANNNSEIAHRAADHASAAICIEIAYLEAVSRQSERLIRSDSDPQRTAVRVRQLAITNILIGLLRAEVNSCPRMDTFERALDDFEHSGSSTPTPAPTP